MALAYTQYTCSVCDMNDVLETYTYLLTYLLTYLPSKRVGRKKQTKDAGNCLSSCFENQLSESSKKVSTIPPDFGTNMQYLMEWKLAHLKNSTKSIYVS